MMCNNLPTESVTFAAYRILFPSDTEVTRELLRAVELPEIKSAFRKLALDTHPDRFASADETFRKDCADRFIEVTAAYETLSRYLSLRENGFEFRSEFEIKADGAKGRAQPSGNRSRRRQKPKSPTPPPDPGEEMSGFKYRGEKAPSRRLRFGEFLYFSGIISWSFLIKALVWQRQQGARIGDIGQRWRWFTESEIACALEERRPGELLGETLLRQRLISSFQLNVLLRQQKKMHKPIGEYFVQQGLLSETEIRRYLQRQEIHNFGIRSAGKPFSMHRARGQGL